MRDRLPTTLLLLTTMLAGAGGCGEASEPPEDSATVSPASPPPRSHAAEVVFTDVSDEAGARTASAFSVAFVDYDGDDWPDLTVGTIDGVVLLRNRGDGTFSNETHRVEEPSGERIDVTTTVWGDVDGDGRLDLYVGRREGPDYLLRGTADGGLESMGVAVPTAIGVAGVSFDDYDGDGDLDIFVGVAQDPAVDSPGMHNSSGQTGAPDHLLRNDGHALVDVAPELGVMGRPNGETFAGLFADLDRDGDRELMVVTATDADYLYRNDGGVFTDVTADTLGPRLTSLMGLTVADYDGDGLLDIYGTDAQPDSLYRGLPGLGFENVFPAVLKGAPDPTATLTAWGVSFLDADSDGHMDVISVSDFDPFYLGDNDEPELRPGVFVFLRADGHGGFVDATDAVGLGGATISAQGLAVADYDRDGDPDVAVALFSPTDIELGYTLHEGVQLLRNDGTVAPQRRSLELSLRQEGANRWAVGAVVDVVTSERSQTRVVTAGESYLSANDFTLHFGLGAADSADVTVLWPDGVEAGVGNVAAGRHRIQRGGAATSVSALGGP